MYATCRLPSSRITSENVPVAPSGSAGGLPASVVRAGHVVAHEPVQLLLPGVAASALNVYTVIPAPSVSTFPFAVSAVPTTLTVEALEPAAEGLAAATVGVVTTAACVEEPP